jgi:broad specificity phosphatase PhoE
MPAARRSLTSTIMPKLILIKHAAPDIKPDVPSRRWVLSAEGRARCGWLARELRTQGVRKLYCSLEPKALETAALVAVALGFEVHPRENLHENDRTGQGLVSADEIKARIRRFFAEPKSLVMGAETALQAAARFAGAIRAVLAEEPEQTVAVVTHGTVLTTFVAAHNPIDPFDFWESLSLPGYVVLDAESLKTEGAAHAFQEVPDLPNRADARPVTLERVQQLRNDLSE